MSEFNTFVRENTNFKGIATRNGELTKTYKKFVKSENGVAPLPPHLAYNPVTKRIVKAKKLYDRRYKRPTLKSAYRHGLEVDTSQGYSVTRRKKPQTIIIKRRKPPIVTANIFTLVRLEGDAGRKTILEHASGRYYETSPSRTIQAPLNRLLKLLGKVISNQNRESGSSYQKLLVLAAGSGVDGYMENLESAEVFFVVSNVSQSFQQLRYENLANAVAYQTGKQNIVNRDFSYSLETNVVNGDYIPKACWWTLIVDVFKEPIERKFANRSITYETLRKLCNFTRKDWGATFDDVLPFFKAYRVACYVMDRNRKIVRQYNPEKPNNRIPNRIYVIWSNQHVYLVNRNLKQLDQIKNSIKKESAITDRYALLTKQRDVRYEVIHSVDEIKPYLTEQFDEFQYITLKTDMCLHQVCNRMLKRKDIWVIPRVMVGACGEFRGLCINNIDSEKHGSRSVVISNEASDYSMNVSVNDMSKQRLEEYQDQRFQVFSSILSKNYLSCYDASVREMFKKYFFVPSSYAVGELYEGGLLGLDFNKFYPSLLMEMPKIPVINQFDKVERYDGHSLEDMTIYYVEVGELSQLQLMYIRSTYRATYGIHLKKADFEYTIKGFLRPSRLVKNSSRGVFDRLYQSGLSNDEKKFIMNSVIGMTGKRKNTRVESEILFDAPEAEYYRDTYGGTVMKYDVDRPLLDPDRMNAELAGEIIDSGEKYYLWSNKQEKELIDGFFLIQMFVYDAAMFKVYELAKEVQQEVNILPSYVKVDCLLYDDRVCCEALFKRVLPEMFDYRDKQHWDAVGKLKFERKEDMGCAPLHMVHNDWEEVKETVNAVNTIYPKDEWDDCEMKQHLAKSRTMLLGKYAGVGKTESCVRACEVALFVCPYNKLCEDLRARIREAVTFCKLFGIRYDDNGTESECANMDIKDYETIIFDEIGLLTPPQLARIKHVMEMYPEKRFLATCDQNQLAPIYNLSVKDTKAYYKRIIDSLFPNQILLKISKRCKTEKGRQRLYRVSDGIMNSKTPAERIAVLKKENIKFIKTLKQVKGYNNVSYYRETANSVNEVLHQKVIKRSKDRAYWFKGLEVICSEPLRKQGIHLGCRYTITRSTKDQIEFKKNDKQYVLKRNVFENHFKLPYCSTVHSVQGMSIDGKMVIFDIHEPHVTNEWLNTAVTRTRDLNKVYIFDGTLGEKNKIRRWRKAVEKKIADHSRVCRSKGQYVQDEYVTVDDVMKELEKSVTCRRCGCVLETKGNRQLVLNRIDNNVGLLKNNWEPICYICNVRYG